MSGGAIFEGKNLWDDVLCVIGNVEENFGSAWCSGFNVLTWVGTM